MKASLRASFAALASSVALLVASTALAEGEACFNDDDCPGTACGDSVCNWSKSAAVPDGDKRFYCNPAGSQPKGNDGWCTDDTDCKCKAQGATCGPGPYCTFTKASDAPAGGGTAGAASTGGSATGGTPASAGTTSTAGTATTAGTTSSGGTGAAPAPADEGGCSVSAPRASGSGVAFGLGLLGLGYVLARRRR